MIRLHMIVEGQTEEAFVNSVLVEHLALGGVFADVRCVETGRQRRLRRTYRGGLVNYEKAKNDLLRWMKEDQNSEVYFTTMFDLFRLPSGFPQYAEAKKKPDPYQRVGRLEEGFAGDLSHPRFLPYIQLHEFEALLLASPAHFDVMFPDAEKAVGNLCDMAAKFESPELIDDGPETAPSKRIIKEIPTYESRKASAGPAIAARIGLDTIRKPLSALPTTGSSGSSRWQKRSITGEGLAALGVGGAGGGVAVVAAP